MFNAKEMQDQYGSTGLGPGFYSVEIETAEIKQTSLDQSDMFTFSFRVRESLSGSYKNAVVYENACYGHSNPETGKYAKAKIAQLMLTLGIEEATPEELCELVKGRTMTVQARKAASGRIWYNYLPAERFGELQQSAQTLKPVETKSPIEPPIDFEGDIPF